METLNLNHKTPVSTESLQYFFSDTYEFFNVLKFHDTQEVKQFFQLIPWHSWAILF